MTLNPAMTGVMNCKMRVTANYRNQWSSVLRSDAYRTYAVGFDMRQPVGRYDYFGFGAQFWGDQVGSSSFGTLKGKLSGSYAKRLGGSRTSSHFISVGADLGVAQRSVDLLALYYGNQWDGGSSYDPSLPSNETFDLDNYIFLDMAAGLMYFNTFDEDNSLYFGLAFNHLNRANQSFLSTENESLYSKFTIHGGAELMLSNRLGVVPNAVVLLQGPSMEINAGTAVKFLLSNPRNDTYQALQIGAWVRISNTFDRSVLADAAILHARFDFEQFALGLSYDVNISDLKPASNRNGSLELALQYKICPPERRAQYCPRNF